MSVWDLVGFGIGLYRLGSCLRRLWPGRRRLGPVLGRRIWPVLGRRIRPGLRRLGWSLGRFGLVVGRTTCRSARLSATATTAATTSSTTTAAAAAAAS